VNDRGDADELRRLARPRALLTRELDPFNAFYGHATILRRYAGVSNARPLKAALEHGPALFENGDDPDLGTFLPRYFCASSSQAAFYERSARHGTKATAIGAPFLYSQALAPVRSSPPRKTLLFFAAHSTHLVTTRYDVAAAAEHLEAFRADFDDVVVCVYWRDVLLGRADIYLGQGYRCVTAGHMFDPAFLFRLADIVSSASVVATHRFGSHVLYSALLGRPVWMTPAAFEYDFAPAVRGTVQMAPTDVYDRALALFSDRVGELTTAQRAFVEELCGMDQFRSPPEMLALIEEAEQAYRQTTPASWKLRLRAGSTARLARNIVAAAPLRARPTKPGAR
jgi:hypothetical protein